MFSGLNIELTRARGTVRNQINEVNKLAEELKCEPWEVRDHTGNFILAPLLVADAQLLLALTMLETYRKGN
jgi:hypothetical protein